MRRGGVVSAEDLKQDSPSENNVTVNEDYDMVYGGGDETNAENSFLNRVTVNGGKIGGVIGGMSMSGKAYNNTVIINGGNILGGVVGGVTFFPYDSNATAGDIYGNQIIINGGTVNFVSGGEIAYTYPTASDSDFNFYPENFLIGRNVSDNSISINGGNITDGVSGGSALTGNVSNNTINLNGGTISGYVIGGEVRYPQENSFVTGNTINIGNSNNPLMAPDLSGAYIVGGLLGDSYTPTGNTLNIYASNVTAKNIAGFDSVNFFVSNNSLNNPSPILTLTNGSTSLNLAGIGVQMAGNTIFKPGDTVNLIYNPNGLTPSSTFAQTTITRGITSIYGLNLALNPGSTGITATVGNKVGENTEVIQAINNPVIAPLVIVPPVVNLPTQSDIVGNIFVDEDGYFMDEEDSKAQIAERVHENRGFELFLDTGGSHMKTKTGNGSYVKANSTNYDVGMAKTLNMSSGNLYIAPVIEYNKGDYDSVFKNGSKGNGDSKYTAGGIVARKINNNGFYYEGSFRAGRAKNNFMAENFFVNGVPQSVGYDISSPLYAAHIRVGTFRRLNRNNAMEIYGIAAYSRQSAVSTDLSSGERVNFSSVHSNLERIGYRLNTRINKMSRIYTGIAFQYESNSGSSASGDDWSDSTSGSRGASAMLEVGWQFKPVKSLSWMIDTYATGWVGHQSGFTAMAKIKKAF